MSENRITDLLADQLLFGLDAAEQEELRELADLTADKETDSFELAAAVVDLSMLNPETMPENLERKLIRQGHEAIGSDGIGHSDLDSSLATAVEDVDSSSREKPHQNPTAEKKTSDLEQQGHKSPGNRIREIVAWGCAASIGFIALMIWTDARNNVKDLEQKLTAAQSRNSELENESKKLGKRVLTLVEDKRKLTVETSTLLVENKDLKKKLSPNGQEIYRDLAELERAIRWKWSPTENADTAGSGEVVWDGESQQGVMRLVDLEMNDPLTSQYQLWIIEEDGRENPVDGGVFNVTKKGEVFIPIDAKLFAGKPAAFAITIEKPNGVVVSKRDQLPLIAQASEKDK